LDRDLVYGLVVLNHWSIMIKNRPNSNRPYILFHDSPKLLYQMVLKSGSIWWMREREFDILDHCIESLLLPIVKRRDSLVVTAIQVYREILTWTQS
jgi:hypothetical protein